LKPTLSLLESVESLANQVASRMNVGFTPYAVLNELATLVSMALRFAAAFLKPVLGNALN